VLRMTQPSAVLSIFAMFLHTTFGESGCTSADGDGTLGDDEPDNFDIDCFSQLDIKDSLSSLTCNFSELPPYNTNYTLSLCTKEDNNYACSNMKKQEDAFFLQFNDILSNRDICMYSEMKRRVCRSLIVTDIVKPEVPFAINITYEREANEYLIRYCTPHSRKKYLQDKLVHQVAYRQREATWKVSDVVLACKNGEFGEKNGKFWGKKWKFWGENREFCVKKIDFLGFKIWKFWGKTWGKFGNFDISFNPESLGYVDIHKVDDLLAKAELENFLQTSTAPETNPPEKCRSGSDLKMLPVITDKTRPNLPLPFGAVWPAEALHRLLGPSQFAVTEGSCSSSTYEVCHGSRLPLHRDGFNLPSTAPLDPSGQPLPQPLNDGTVSQMLLSGDMRSPNNEEAYVTMSNFYKIQ
uniref:Interleukin 7 receptor n=1 Tax=Malurus cyaneus samueli TaxID=2593467 RepID=A0A8C5TQW1_9PASS